MGTVPRHRSFCPVLCDLQEERKAGDHSTKFLIRSQVPDIIQLRIEASLRDSLHWCDLQSLG